MRRVRDAISDVPDRTTLADFLRQVEAGKVEPVFHSGPA
jgi:hypothetical protein